MSKLLITKGEGVSDALALRVVLKVVDMGKEGVRVGLY